MSLSRHLSLTCISKIPLMPASQSQGSSFQVLVDVLNGMSTSTQRFFCFIHQLYQLFADDSTRSKSFFDIWTPHSLKCYTWGMAYPTLYLELQECILSQWLKFRKNLIYDMFYTQFFDQTNMRKNLLRVWVFVIIVYPSFHWNKALNRILSSV